MRSGFPYFDDMGQKISIFVHHSQPEEVFVEKGKEREEKG